jgi:hypothetical protein
MAERGKRRRGTLDTISEVIGGVAEQSPQILDEIADQASSIANTVLDLAGDSITTISPTAAQVIRQEQGETEVKQNRIRRSRGQSKSATVKANKAVNENAERAAQRKTRRAAKPTGGKKSRK